MMNLIDFDNFWGKNPENYMIYMHKSFDTYVHCTYLFALVGANFLFLVTMVTNMKTKFEKISLA